MEEAARSRKDWPDPEELKRLSKAGSRRKIILLAGFMLFALLQGALLLLFPALLIKAGPVIVLEVPFLLLVFYLFSCREREESDQSYLRDHHFILSPDPKCILDEQGKIIFTNSAFKSTLGNKGAESSGTFCMILEEKEREEVRILIRKALYTGKTIEFQTAIKGSEGETRWMLWNTLTLKTGKLIELSGRNITFLKQQEEKLRISYAAMESAASGISLLNREGKIIWVNSSFCRISGYPREDLLGKAPGFLGSGLREESFYQEIWDTVSTGLIWSGEVVNRRPNGSLYTLEETIAPIYDASGEISHYVSVHQDISERKKAEQILRENAEFLENELSLAGEVHRSLLPASVPELKDYEIGSYTLPARYVSGDLYDLFIPQDGKLLLTLSDISGKGISAAMLSSSIKTLIRVFCDPDEPGRMLGRVNRILLPELSNSGLFITLLALSLDLEEGIIKYSSAGHPPAIVIRGEAGESDLLPATAPPLGVVDTDSFEEKEYALSPGDILILYSDGITETRNPDWQFFGVQRLISLAEENFRLDLPQLIDRILEEVTRFRGEATFFDDLSLIILKAKNRLYDFTYQADLSKLEEACGKVKSLCRGYGEEFAYHMELITSELLTNIIQHGFTGETGEFHLRLSLEPGVATLDLFDRAKPFDFSKLPKKEPELLSEGSYGLGIVSKLSSELSYTPGGPEGNNWHVIKRRREK